MKAREKDNPEEEDYYIEFNIKQQKRFENCIIDNQAVVTPERLICLSNIRILDMRKFVYFRVLDNFHELDISNIELAYRKKEGNKRHYVSLQGSNTLTLHDLIKRGLWDRKKCDLALKDKSGIQIGNPRQNETLYIRFI